MYVSDWELKHHMCQRLHPYVTGRNFKLGKTAFVQTIELQLNIARSITLAEFKKSTGATIDE